MSNTVSGPSAAAWRAVRDEYGRAVDERDLKGIWRRALAAAHDPANFEDPRDVSVNLGDVVDALDRARAVGYSREAGCDENASTLLLRTFGGSR